MLLKGTCSQRLGENVGSCWETRSITPSAFSVLALRSSDIKRRWILLGPGYRRTLLGMLLFYCCL